MYIDVTSIIIEAPWWDLYSPSWRSLCICVSLAGRLHLILTNYYTHDCPTDPRDSLWSLSKMMALRCFVTLHPHIRATRVKHLTRRCPLNAVPRAYLWFLYENVFSFMNGTNGLSLSHRGFQLTWWSLKSPREKGRKGKETVTRYKISAIFHGFDMVSVFMGNTIAFCVLRPERVNCTIFESILCLINDQSVKVLENLPWLIDLLLNGFCKIHIICVSSGCTYHLEHTNTY